MNAAGKSSVYALGHSGRELERLSMQARICEPFTRRMLEHAGLSPGMRVLDVGTGAGDVALLCASLVGPQGAITAVDRAPEAVETARQRARGAGLANVTFAIGDPAGMAFETPFDAVVGRLVLMHQREPAAMLRKLSAMVRPGGIVAFQEYDISGARTFPPAPTFEQCIRWVTAALNSAGTDSQMGARLYSIFIEAGLPGPSMSLDAGIWGGAENPGATMVTEVVRSLLPLLVKTGIATEEQVDIGSLRERIQREILAAGGVAIMPSLIGAWTRIP
jgi:ubiquinone/menaquinone biosynthesis C-methylase UbiE